MHIRQAPSRHVPGSPEPEPRVHPCLLAQDGGTGGAGHRSTYLQDVYNARAGTISDTLSIDGATVRTVQIGFRGIPRYPGSTRHRTRTVFARCFGVPAYPSLRLCTSDRATVAVPAQAIATVACAKHVALCSSDPVPSANTSALLYPAKGLQCIPGLDYELP